MTLRKPKRWDLLYLLTTKWKSYIFQYRLITFVIHRDVLLGVVQSWQDNFLQAGHVSSADEARHAWIGHPGNSGRKKACQACHVPAIRQVRVLNLRQADRTLLGYRRHRGSDCSGSCNFSLNSLTCCLSSQSTGMTFFNLVNQLLKLLLKELTIPLDRKFEGFHNFIALHVLDVLTEADTTGNEDLQWLEPLHDHVHDVRFFFRRHPDTLVLVGFQLDDEAWRPPTRCIGLVALSFGLVSIFVFVVSWHRRRDGGRPGSTDRRTTGASRNDDGGDRSCPGEDYVLGGPAPVSWWWVGRRGRAWKMKAIMRMP